MISLMAIILVGFFLGMRHATDADHVIAVTTIVSRQKSVGQAAWIGVLWGLGHTFTIFLVGAAIILLNVAIPPRLGLAMELSVGIMLVLLGCLNISGITQRITERVTPLTEVSGSFETRPLASAEMSGAESRLDRMFQGMGRYQVFRPLIVGVVHGLAGSAAIALLLLTTIRDPWEAFSYLLIFGLGTIAGMMLITACIAMPFAYTAGRFAGFNRGMALASGLLSLFFGIFVAYQIGFVDGLFTSHPHWIPR